MFPLYRKNSQEFEQQVHGRWSSCYPLPFFTGDFLPTGTILPASFSDVLNGHSLVAIHLCQFTMNIPVCSPFGVQNANNRTNSHLAESTMGTFIPDVSWPKTKRHKEVHPWKSRVEVQPRAVVLLKFAWHLHVWLELFRNLISGSTLVIVWQLGRMTVFWNISVISNCNFNSFSFFFSNYGLFQLVLICTNRNRFFGSFTKALNLMLNTYVDHKVIFFRWKFSVLYFRVLIP